MDNKPLALRYKTWLRYTFTGWFIILILASFGVLIIMGLGASLVFKFAWAENFDFMFAGMLIFLFFISVLNALLGAYMIRFFWKYRLIFGKTHFGHKTIPHPFVKPFAQRYEDILKVTRGEYRGTIKIIPKTGKPLQIRANIFEGGTERLLEAFSVRFRPEQMDPELRETLWKFNKLDRITWGVSSITILFSIIYVGVTTPFLPWSLETRWWKPIPKTTGYVSAFSIDSDGSIWAVANKLSNRTEYTVWHISDQGEKFWEFKKEKTDDGTDFPTQVAHDGDGNPWIFFYHEAYYWNHDQWVETTTSFNELKSLGSIFGWLVADGNIWSLIYPGDKNTAKLAQWNLSNDQYRIIALPDTKGAEYLEDIRLTQTRELLLLRNPKERVGALEIFQLNDIDWNLISTYQLLKNTDHSLYYSGVTIDTQGFIWLLLPDDSLHENLLARFDPTTKVWEETQLPSQNTSNVGLLYRGLEIDLKGRVWVEGNTYKTGNENIFVDDAFVAVLQPNWQSTSSILRLYTGDSTNLDIGSGSLQIDSKGRVWYGDHWMDANVENLPQPLPLSGNLNIIRIFYPFGFFLISFPLLGILYYFQRKIECENTSKIQGQQST